MNKKAAKELAESETLSIGDLRTLIASKRGAGGFSRVNPAIPLERVLDIYSNALEGRDDAEIPKAFRLDVYSRVGAMKPSRDSLIIKNILRDCK